MRCKGLAKNIIFFSFVKILGYHNISGQACCMFIHLYQALILYNGMQYGLIC